MVNFPGVLQAFFGVLASIMTDSSDRARVDIVVLPRASVGLVGMLLDLDFSGVGIS